MKKNPVLKRVRFTFEALCRVDGNAENMDLASVFMECSIGEMSGISLGSPEVTLLDLKQARLAVEQHGTDPQFFDLPKYAVGARVWWTDPDQGSSSGWYRIVEANGEEYAMVNTAGGECEAMEHELSLRKPKK